jgi:hypothetical protein
MEMSLSAKGISTYLCPLLEQDEVTAHQKYVSKKKMQIPGNFFNSFLINNDQFLMLNGVTIVLKFIYSKTLVCGGRRATPPPSDFPLSWSGIHGEG